MLVRNVLWLQQSYRAKAARNMDGDIDCDGKLGPDLRPRVRVRNLQGVRDILDIRHHRRQLCSGRPSDPPHLEAAHPNPEKDSDGEDVRWDC